MQDITAETVEYPKNCPYCAEEHLLILWPNAHGAKAFARKMLTSDGLQVTDEVEIQFTKNKILNKITQLYAVDVEKANKRQKITGDGTLTTFVVKDLNPEYRTVWRYGTGYTSTNIKIYKCKQKLREKLGHPFLVHSTNDTTEAKRDFRLILGPRFREDRTIVEESFHTADDILNFLNDVDDYLVLRDYSGGDIDILTRRPASELAHLLKATHSRMRLIEFPREKLLPKIDIVHPHHGIFCPIWCERMLETRVFDSSTNRFRPNNENLTFSLIYHYLLYKESIPQHSQLILRKCIETAGYHELSTLDFANHNQWIYVLSKYLKKNGYSVPQSIDLSLSRNENTRSAIIKLSQLDRVACIPDSNPEYTVQETNNIDKWAHFDLIKIAKLLLKKSIHDQQSLQGVEKGHELLVSPLLERINVPFATKINGERENYLLKIFYSNYAHVIESIESSLRAASRLTDAQLCTPKKIERFNNLILTIEKYIEGKVLAKFFTADYAHALTEIENKLDALTSILVRNAIMHGDIH
ncbi:MAG: hypothetical protein FJY58_09555, partial [Betaproteobacteria bacterium]|nr:hypothetical protein [Betaproteobacteria bacterium]